MTRTTLKEAGAAIGFTLFALALIMISGAMP